MVADLVHRGGEAVQRGAGVVAAQPDGGAVIRVAGAGVVLLLALVEDGDAVVEQREGHDVARLRQI